MLTVSVFYARKDKTYFFMTTLKKKPFGGKFGRLSKPISIALKIKSIKIVYPIFNALRHIKKSVFKNLTKKCSIQYNIFLPIGIRSYPKGYNFLEFIPSD